MQTDLIRTALARAVLRAVNFRRCSIPHAEFDALHSRFLKAGVLPGSPTSPLSRPGQSHSRRTSVLPTVVDQKETEQPMPTSKTTAGDRDSALCALAAKVAACTRCDELARTRTQTVFGVGNPQARVMFVGEAPGADEDRLGEPFVGRAGQMLNRIIIACGWTRDDIYICNVLRCRPPDNRHPSPDEADNCREYLDGQIDIVKPEFIVCWGILRGPEPVEVHGLDRQDAPTLVFVRSCTRAVHLPSQLSVAESGGQASSLGRHEVAARRDGPQAPCGFRVIGR